MYVYMHVSVRACVFARAHPHARPLVLSQFLSASRHRSPFVSDSLRHSLSLSVTTPSFSLSHSLFLSSCLFISVHIYDPHVVLLPCTCHITVHLSVSSGAVRTPSSRVSTTCQAPSRRVPETFPSPRPARSRVSPATASPTARTNTTVGSTELSLRLSLFK